MRFTSPTLLILSISLLFGSSGCASIAKILPWSDSEPDEAAEYANDPVAAAAMRMRRPASQNLGSSSDDQVWSRGYAPPSDTIKFGMAMDEVAAAWGEPGNIDTAGDPNDGNQRWTYFSGLSSRYGLGNKRIVYFEAGHVAGWKK